MKLIKTNKEEIKKSKFIAYYYELDTTEDIKIIIDELKKRT